MPDRASAQLVVRPVRPPCNEPPPGPPITSIRLRPVSLNGRAGTLSTSAPPVGLNSVSTTASNGGLISVATGSWTLALVEAAGKAGVASATPVFVMNAFASDTGVGHLGLVQLPGGTQLQLTQSPGIGATGKVAILTQTLVGIQAGTATGTVSSGRPPLALVQSNGVGTRGTPLEGVALSQTGVSATGTIGNALPPSVRAMTQSSATGNVGSITFTRSIPSLTNDSGSTALGSFTPAPILGDLVTSVGGVNIVTVIASDQVVTVSHFVPGSGGYVLSCPALAVQTGSTNSPAMVQSRDYALAQNAAVGVNGGIATVGGGNNVLSGNQAGGDVGSVQAPLIGNVAALTIVQAAAITGLSFVMGIPGADVTTVSGSSVFTVGGTQVDTIGAGSSGTTPLTFNRGTGKTGQVVASFPGQGTFALTGIDASGDTGNVTPELPRSGADVVTISGKFVTTIAAVQVDTN